MFANNSFFSRSVTLVLIRTVFLFACLVSTTAYADIITFTQTTLIASTDSSYDNNDIVINGATVTIDGEHGFASLKIINGGVLTHSNEQKISITVAGVVEVDSSSRIDVTGKGLPGDLAAGFYTGGSHGGRGGNYSSYQSGLAYGNYQKPDTLGWGGRNGNTTLANRGGGAIKIVANEFILNGSLLANGVGGSSYGGGAGGSIWLQVNTLYSNTNTAAIRANGANGNYVCGGGGGGRVAIHYQTIENFPESSISASGGVRGASGEKHGVPGTIYFANNNAQKLLLRGSTDDLNAQIEVEALNDGHSLVVDNMRFQLDFRNHQFTTIELKNSGVLTVAAATDELTQGIILTANKITVDASSKIDVSGKGRLGDLAAGYYTGGSHGGRGGNYSSYQSGLAFGNYQKPDTFGWGGRNANNTLVNRGGGAIKIVANEFILNGSLLANGAGGSSYGGGAGGSIWLDVNILRSESTTTAIRANGASGHSYSGGGGGGRVAIYYQTMEGFSDPLLISAAGGVRGSSGEKHGAPGTVYIKSSLTNDPAVLQIKGSSNNSSEMEINEIVIDGLPIRNANEILQVDGASLSLSQDHTFLEVEVTNNGALTIAAATEETTQGIILTANKITVDASSKIDVSGKGLLGDLAAGYYTGGSHGGRGGNYSSYQSGLAYGNYQKPDTFGWGGRNASTTLANRGGGAIKIVANEFILNGSLLANGVGGSGYGGGAGGSIWLDVNILRSVSATAVIRANGASGHSYSGGGGGGRVAIYYQTMEGFPDPLLISASGGVRGVSGEKHGAPGSVYIKQKLTAEPAKLLFYGTGDHGSRMSIENILGDGEITAAEEVLVIDQANWLLEKSHEFLEIGITNTSVVTTRTANSSLDEAIVLKAHKIDLDETSRIDVTGKGLLGEITAGLYTGGSHGGRGGNFSDYQSALVYGLYQEPESFGQGGRSSSSSLINRGGGAIKIVADEFGLQGDILANGTGYSGYGGGAGGSIYLDVGILRSDSSAAEIHASGASGSSYGGGGAGGRIAIYYELMSGVLDDNITVNGGSGGVSNPGATGNGQVGTIYKSLRKYLPYIYQLDIPNFSPTAISSIQVDFSIPIDVATLGVADVVLLNTAQQTINPVSVTAVSDKIFRFDFASPIGEGSYSLRVGPDIFAQNGLQLDQNRNGTGGEVGDVFTFAFVIDLSAPVSVTVDVPVSPAINKSTTTAYVLSGTREADTSIFVNGNQVVAQGSGNWTATITLPQGQSTLMVSARDAAGNSSAPVEVVVNVDSIRPLPQSPTPASGTVVALVPERVTINIVEAGSGLNLAASAIQVKRNTTQISGSLTQNGNQLIFTPSIPFAEGSYTVQPMLVDNHGNTSNPVTYTFVLDYTPPPVPVLNEYPSLTSINTYTFSGTKESGSRILLDGQVVVSGTSSTNWSYAKALTFGDNTFSFKSRDAAGNESPSVVANIRYDDQAPGPVIIAINPNGSGTELTLSWTGYNELTNGNDIATYRIYSATQGYSNAASLTPVLEIPAGTKTAKVTGLARATAYYLSVVAVDRQGLFISEVTPVTATPVDTLAPPEITNLQVVSGLNSLGLSWLPSANTDGDLASYRLSYIAGSEAQTVTLSQADIGNASPITYTLSGLAPATAHTLTVSTVDSAGNVSAGLSNPAITLLPNPQNLQAEGFSGRAELSWSAVSPHALVKHYAIYVQPASFASVEGLAPTLIVAKGSAGQTTLARAVAGLTDGVTVYVAVTAVNLSNGETKAVNAIAVTPQADSEGPVIGSVAFDNNGNVSDFAGAPTLTRSGTVSVTATDKSAVSRVILTLDAQPLANLVSATSGSYQHSLDLSRYADGAHTLGVAVYDTLDNVTQASYSFTLDLAAPAAPVITLPNANQLTNQVNLTVSGTTAAGTRINLFNNGAVVAENLVPNSQGVFSTSVSLAEGENVLFARAKYTDRVALSENSTSRTITLNTEMPNSPTGVTATAAKQGQVYLSWNAVTSSNGANPVTGYRIYRAPTSFNSKTAAGVQLVNTALIPGTAYTDLVITDGAYFYALAAVNQANTESALSAVVQATVDSTGPKALEVIYNSNGLVDATSGRMAPAIVNLSVRFNEPLRNKPYFAIVPNGGVPIAVELTKSFSDEQLYTGQFQIKDATPSGTAYVVMSAYDNAGNRGTEVVQGGTLLLDTDGPEVASLALNPADPLKVDEANGLSVDVALTLTDELPPSASPTLIPLINGSALAGYEQGVSLSRDALSTAGSPLWLGTFNLPTAAGQDDQGQPAVENLSFSYSARDDLNNVATRIAGKNSFQVYQGDLPPLEIPTNLTARAQAGGRVSLSWNNVSGASGYVIYRQGPTDTEFAALGEPLTATTLIDETPADGTYQYALASIRRENQQEALSARSNIVSVQTDRVAPGAPQNLVLELNGAGLVSRWAAPTLDAAGNPQNQQGISYNLYRLNLPEGQQIADLTGLTPIQTAIPALIALDTAPSESEHSYFVTAVDAAGNQSAPSATGYLNFGLLPVNRLNLVLTENGFPQLTWQHQGLAISHYRVYRSQGEDEPLLISNEPVAHTGTTTTYVDRGYNQAQGSKGAATEVRYTVVAVDDNGVESLGHSILLPALSVSLADAENTRLQRGVMNRINFRVDNQGSEAITGVRLHVSLTVDGVLKQHQSEAFSVEAGAFAQVPVVIGGYAKLDGIADLQLRLELKPQVNESVTVHQSASVLVTSASLLANLITEDFVRGGAGKASFTLENTSDIETEIVVATSNGTAPSDEVRLVLEDLQGNVLSIQPVKQFTGAVVSISNGRTIARLTPGQTFTSAPIEILVPQAAPDQVRLRLVIDKFHYQLGRDTHVEITGVGARRELVLSETPYTVSISSIAPLVIYGPNEKVTITGQALDRSSQQPLANVPVTLVLTVRGFEKLVTVYTNSEGTFSHDYYPEGTSGTYRVSALHPDVRERPNQGEFRVEGGSVSPAELTVNIPRNYTQKIPIRVNAGYDSVLTNVRLVQISLEAGSVAQLPLGVTATHDPVGQIPARGTGYLNLNFNGDNSAGITGTLKYRVEADNFTGAKALGEVTLRYTLSEAAPAIASQPAYIDTGVGLEQQILENITVTNKGLDILQNAQIALTMADGSAIPGWVRLGTAPQLGNLAIGQSQPVQFTVAPGADVSEGNYEFRLWITGDNLATPFKVPVFVAVTQSGQGNAFFHTSDIYTATLDQNNQLVPGLSGARIRLQNEQVLTETYDLSTNALGEALFEGIPAGRYVYRASAFDHTSVSGRVWVKPGVTTAEDVFLMNSLVTVEWSVREITIEDRYEIKLDATFETKVPVALVMFSPLNVQLPVMKQGDIFYGELTLTNHGLIRATNVQSSLPTGNDMARLEFLREIPASLEAGDVFTLPYRIQALRDFNPEADANATGGGCGSFGAQARVNYQSQCSNGTVVPGGTSANWNSNWGGSSCGGGGGGSSGGSGSISYYGGGTGSGSDFAPLGSPLGGGGNQCAAPPACEECNKDNGAGG